MITRLYSRIVKSPLSLALLIRRHYLPKHHRGSPTAPTADLTGRYTGITRLSRQPRTKGTGPGDGLVRPLDMVPPEAERMARLGFLLVGGFLVALLIAGLIVQLPVNALVSPSRAQRDAAQTVWPQGWAFFTKSPRSVEIIPFRRVSGHWRLAAMTPQVRLANAFGLSRRQRAQGPEVAILSDAIPSSGWTACDAYSPDECSPVLQRLAPVQLQNTALDPSLCGQILFALGRPVPWAYAGLTGGHTWRVERAALTELQCARK